MNFLLRRPFLTARPLFRRGIDEFFDNITKPGETPYAGRAWKPRELRLKSLNDLHKLWFVLLKERNKLLTEKAHVETGKEMLNPTRVGKVRESMRGIKIVIGERMRLKKAERQLALAKDPKEIKTLTQLIDDLRKITGTPAIPLPEAEVPYEERTVTVPRPVTTRWWQAKADALQAAREQRKKEREDPEFEAKQQAKLKEDLRQKEIARAEATRTNRANKLKNRKRKEKERVRKLGISQRKVGQKRETKKGVAARTIAAAKK